MQFDFASVFPEFILVFTWPTHTQPSKVAHNRIKAFFFSVLPIGPKSAKISFSVQKWLPGWRLYNGFGTKILQPTRILNYSLLLKRNILCPTTLSVYPLLSSLCCKDKQHAQALLCRAVKAPLGIPASLSSGILSRLHIIWYLAKIAHKHHNASV